MKKLMIYLKTEESGQGMVEYSLILVLIVIVTLGAVTILGTKTLNLYQDTLAKMP